MSVPSPEPGAPRPRQVAKVLHWAGLFPPVCCGLFPPPEPGAPRARPGGQGAARRGPRRAVAAARLRRLRRQPVRHRPGRARAAPAVLRPRAPARPLLRRQGAPGGSTAASLGGACSGASRFSRACAARACWDCSFVFSLTNASGRNVLDVHRTCALSRLSKRPARGNVPPRFHAWAVWVGLLSTVVWRVGAPMRRLGWRPPVPCRRPSPELAGGAVHTRPPAGRRLQARARARGRRTSGGSWRTGACGRCPRRRCATRAWTRTSCCTSTTACGCAGGAPCRQPGCSWGSGRSPGDLRRPACSCRRPHPKRISTYGQQAPARSAAPAPGALPPSRAAGGAPAAPGPCRVRASRAWTLQGAPPPASAPRPGPRPGRTARAQGELAKAGDDVPEHLRVALPPDAPRGALGAVLERSRRLCLARYEKERFCERAYLDHYRRSRELHLSPEQLAVYAGAPLAVPNPSPIPVSASCMSRGAPTEPLLPVRPWLSLTLAPSLCRPPACRGVLLLSLCWGAHVCARWGVLQIARFLMRVLQLREDRQDKQGHRILMSGRQCRFKFACASWLRAARA